jgi:hypothetical protein
MTIPSGLCRAASAVVRVRPQVVRRMFKRHWHPPVASWLASKNYSDPILFSRGVYAVETKSFRKPRDASDVRDDPSHQVRYDGKGLVFPVFATREPVEQALRQAQWLRRFLRDAVNREVPVTPAVALPGWYVVRTDEGKRADVQVFSPMGKGPEFMAWNPERVASDQAD